MDCKTIAHSNQKPFISDNLRQLLKSLGSVRYIERNTFIFQQGMNAENVYLIKSGLIRISMISSEGRELCLRICKSGDIVGELTLYCDNPKYLLNAKAIEPAEIISVNIERIHQELTHDHLLATELMRWVSNHMRKYQMKMKDYLLNGKKGALYSTIIRLSNSYGIKHKDGILINIVFKDQEIANFCGATREYVNRMLGELRTDNILSIHSSGKLLIKDLAYLKRINNCEDCSIEICNIN